MQIFGIQKREQLHKRKANIITLILVLLCWAIAFLPSSAKANESDYECGQIQVALLEVGTLFYKLPDGRFSGIDKDILDALSLRTNCQFKIRIESQARLWAQMREGSLDMSTSGIKTAEREKWAASIPYFSARNYALLNSALSTQEQTAQGFIANKNLKVAVIKGFQHGKRYNEFIDTLAKQGRIYEVADFASLLKLFNAKRVQCIFLIPTSYLDLSRQKNLPDNAVLRDWYPSDAFIAGLYLSKSKVSTKTVQLLQNTMSAMQADGSLERIFSRYVGDKLAKEMMLDTGPTTITQ
ncbi:transporter substrate-binding domain-containing protein [Undibacterium sp. LX40W]|uniref:Transporter substrate-binding domain-containing protein n=1 Tax=Undibacterium nitidum TaxID=2762298 RepID=A0A923HMI3_9BURK|nr:MULTISPECIES: transporter substrate-binding domain-containing protein [Undibacterium]MBC3880521.1 transporter substrate-binding domain-containing protein [Undibacterium nitidum]MBC3890743.1 transporter substrate-binding domain-containing protein [Undibacterium sp. LX40W]